ncbi:MAG: pilus assembly protein [Pseudomonadota bacterium]|jgi:Flp pilus assembly protein TadG|nr:TadE/TadG family type IV pilus assembly protein [Burkholderia sp. PAMC 28687]MDP9155419.1 pilus assembly protein [Pseudomonadota bacterium]
MKHLKRAVCARQQQRGQRGSTAVEFALIFPLFFLIFYAIVTYSIIFAAKQSLALAASEGARAALKFQPNATSAASALTLRASAACATATGLVNWIATTTPCTATYAPCTFDASMQCVKVSLNYDYGSKPLVPVLPLIGLPTPTTLTANAMVQLNPENLF